MKLYKQTQSSVLLQLRIRKLVSRLTSHTAPKRVYSGWTGLPKYVRVAAAAIVAAAIIGSIWLLALSNASAQTVTFTKDDYLSGDSKFSDIQIGANGTNVQLQKGVAGTWNSDTASGLQNMPSLQNGVSNLVNGPNNTMYLLTSMGLNCHFNKYDLERQTWMPLNTPPITCGAGTLFVYDGASSMYYAPGGSTNSPSNRFFRYDIKDDSWHDLANFPSTIANISSSAYVSQGSNKYMYVFRGVSSPTFWRYNINAAIWESLPSFPTTGSVSRGISMAWDGSNTIYALANETGEFKKFDLSTSTWTNLTQVANSGCVRNTLRYANGLLFAMRLNACGGLERPFLQSYDPVTATWVTQPTPPSSAHIDDLPLTFTYDGSRYAYALIGSDTRHELYRFDTIQKKWTGSSLLNPDQDDTDFHQALMYDGAQAVYYFGGRGGETVDRVFKYDLTTNKATRVGSQIGTVNGYGGVYYQGGLYTLPRWNTTTSFQVYDTALNTMSARADLPITVGPGSSLVEGGDGYIYATVGNGRSNFYRYNVSTNAWSALTSMPQGVSSGGAMSRIGRSIYVLAGGQSSYLMRYNLDTATWSSITGMPSGGVDHGGFMLSDATRYLYIGVSSRTEATAKKVWRYDTTNAVWQRVSDLPAAAKPYASGFYNTVTNKMYVSQGQTSPVIWDWSPNTANYATSGTWYSKTYDLKQVQAWQSLQSTVTGAGTVALSTRSSSDGKIWGDWQQVAGTVIPSAPARYLQIKATLTGDGTATPILSGISINHTQETTPPNLPAQMTARSKKDGDILTSGQTYEHQHPYFSWSAADDGANGSGVVGYYVYFGVDSNADPVTDGSYQQSTDYTVTSAMTAGEVYYLKIKVKDALGAVSSAATYFSYRYFYISPPGSIVKTSNTDFSEGVNTNVAINDGSMRLQGVSGGAWATGPMTMPQEDTRGGAQAVIGDYLYVARGTNTSTFWRYNVVNQVWETLTAVPGLVNSGSSMTYDSNGSLYLMAGGNTNAFYKYDVVNNSWSTLPNLPSNAQQGSDITSIGDGKIAVMFTGVREFYVFDSVNNQFVSKQAYPTSITTGGSGMWYDGNDTIYAYLGSWTWWETGTTRVSMVKYSIANDTWRELATPPALATYTQNNLVSDGKGGLYIFTNNLADNLTKRQHTMRYDIAKDRWNEVPGLTDQIVNGSAVSDGKRFIYILPGGNGTNSRKIIRLDTWSNTITPTQPQIDALDRIPYDIPTNGTQWVGGNATSAVYDGSKYIYAIASNESTTNWTRFVKFDYKTGETQYLPPPPLIGVSGSLGYLNDELYYLPARNTRDFYRFDQTQQQWLRMNDVPSNSYRPSSTALVKVGTSFYLPLGNGRLFYRYTPDANGGIWTKMADAPGSIVNGSTALDESANAIFVIAGNGTAVYRYDIAANTWTTRAALPTTSSYGSAMTWHSGKLYAQLGNATKNSYIYDITSNTWTSGTQSTELFRYGATILKMSDTFALAFSGEGSPDIWKFNYPSDTAAFNGQATHVSQPSAVAGIYDYAGITAQVAIPAATDVELWTRSSDDSITWDEWSVADQIKKYPSSISGKVTSKARQYTQTKVVLQSNDNAATPTVDSYALNYYYDVDPPTNPSVLTAYTSNNKQTEAANNTWYNSAKPLFDWPNPGQPGGAADGPLGSNIAGYWVYLGTDPTASPRTAGTFVSTTEYEADLSVSGNYYLRIQAQDITGNVDGAIYAPYIYKFDNQPPTNPNLITVTPSGFTARNNFTFEWPNAYDANSGVAGYCYHTGANSGPFAAEICQPGKTLSNVSAAYRAGTNVFYVRTYDIAGNFAPGYTTVSYYYATDPPGPVTDFRAIPPTSTQNMFAFSWNLPVLFSGDPDLLTYCYSVNVLPSPLNTTCTTDKFISAFRAATQQGTNIIYIVAKDEAGNANWNNFASANFIANTVSPGIPLNLVVSDTSDRVSNRWSLTATWDTPLFAGNGIRNYIVERSTDGRVFSEIGNTSTRAFVDLDVQPAVTYSYRVRAADNVDNRGGPSGVVSQSAQGNFATPPQIVVQPTSSAGYDQAKISWATNREATSFVYYGTSPSDLSQSKGSLELMTEHTQTVTGLLPSTTYYYRVQSFDNERNYQLKDAYSPIASFRTTEAARIFNVVSSDVTTNSAVISWQTSVPTKSRIDYGPTLGYGLVVDDEATSFSTNHTMKISGLESGVNYHFRIISTTDFGSKLNSDDYTFDTISRPQISTIRFQPVDDGASAAVKVSWKTNVPTSSTVRYDGLGVRQEASLSELTTDHEVTIRDLASSTEYAFTIEGRDQYGNLASSTVQKWQSQVDTRPPSISDVSLNVTVTESAKGKRAQLIAVWKTDEPATSQLSYGQLNADGLTNKTPLDADPTTNHVVIVSNLNLADIYKLQIASRDLNGNTALGATTTVVTPDNETSVFDNILNLMLKLFRF